MSFGDVIRSASSPASNPYGIGGDSNTIWHCDNTTGYYVYELSTTDLSVIRNSNPTTYTWSSGSGGNANIIWYCEIFTDTVKELNTSDLSIVRSAAAQGGKPLGIGGDSNTIWHCDYDSNKIYELDISDFSLIKQNSSPSTGPVGVGGGANTIWHCDAAANKVYELSTSDFSEIQSTATPSIWAKGIGGDANTIWHCQNKTDKLYELDAANVYTLSGTISDEFGNPIRDADITISDGTTYTTTTDENGAYSQIVNSDTYDIAVSKSRSRFHDTTESSVAVTADTTQDITMPTDKMLGRPTIVNGMSIPGGISMGRSKR